MAITAAAAMLAAAPGLAALGLGWLPMAMALGMAVGNLWPSLPAFGAAGLGIARGPLMRAGIALYGLSIGMDELGSVGWAGPLMAAVAVASTLVLGVVAGRRLGIDAHSSLLVAFGSAICGAAAVAAADSVLAARSRQVSAAVATVVVFGTLGMYLLPLCYPLLGLAQPAFGVWLGLTVHELGHVVAAAGAVGPDSAAAALVEKMLRVLLLAPAVVVIAVREGRARAAAGARVRLPFFVWGFIAALAANAAGALPAVLHEAGTTLAQMLLAVGLAALGATTRLADVRRAGRRVWLLAALLWGHLLVSGLLMVSLFAIP